MRAAGSSIASSRYLLNLFENRCNCVHGSERQEPEGLFHADVHSWHVDTDTVSADTYLCTYAGACSEGLPNEQAQRRVDVPATRAELLRLCGGQDDAGFREYMADWFYDLHYVPLPGSALQLRHG